MRAVVGDALPTYVTRQLQMLEHLHAAIAEADREVKAWAMKDPVARGLLTVPGSAR